jgi:heptosyltransferase II
MSVAKERILIVHLEALGAVVRSTSLLASVKRKYPDSHITWVTQKPSNQLLKGNPLIDRVLTTDRDDLLSLSALEFDIALCVDKSLKAAGVLASAKFDKLFGFKVDGKTGAILPATDAAVELWELGLSDYKKFFVNKKPETQLSREALELPLGAQGDEQVTSDDYYLPLTKIELELAAERRKQWAGANEWVVGLNTGCSDVIQYKKLSIETHRELAQRLQAVSGVRVVLLGGPEDELRNQRIAHGLDVVQTPTQSGLRDGLVSVQACDIVITGDSLGMHMAIALKKWVVAWFGPTCAHEIELYGRGVKVLSQAACSPCWKRQCNKEVMCYDLVSVPELLLGVSRGMQFISSESRAEAKRSESVGRNQPTDSNHSDGIRGRPFARNSSSKTT